jgi:hypothetical protein
MARVLAGKSRMVPIRKFRKSPPVRFSQDSASPYMMKAVVNQLKYMISVCSLQPETGNFKVKQSCRQILENMFFYYISVQYPFEVYKSNSNSSEKKYSNLRLVTGVNGTGYK